MTCENFELTLLPKFAKTLKSFYTERRSNLTALMNSSVSCLK